AARASRRSHRHERRMRSRGRRRAPRRGARSFEHLRTESIPAREDVLPGAAALGFPSEGPPEFTEPRRPGTHRGHPDRTVDAGTHGGVADRLLDRRQPIDESEAERTPGEIDPPLGERTDLLDGALAALGDDGEE